MSDHLELSVEKTFKLFIGGSFPRSESGRSFPVLSADGNTIGWAAQASRKDLRDAVVAARAATGKWAEATPYLRGQIIYRIAEMLDSRLEHFDQLLREAGNAAPSDDLSEAVDSLIWWAGLSDKLQALLGSTNPVAGPFLNVSSVEPTGVVGVVMASQPSMGSIANQLGAVLVGGNTVVAVFSRELAVLASTFAEVLAVSDLPDGTVNILTGDLRELAPVLAGHHDVDAIDISGSHGDLTQVLETTAADSVKRVRHSPPERSLIAAAGFLETKTVWHPARI